MKICVVVSSQICMTFVDIALIHATQLYITYTKGRYLLLLAMNNLHILDSSLFTLPPQLMFLSQWPPSTDRSCVFKDEDTGSSHSRVFESNEGEKQTYTFLENCWNCILRPTLNSVTERCLVTFILSNTFRGMVYYAIKELK